MFETIRRTLTGTNTNQRKKSKSIHTISGSTNIVPDSNEETDSSLSDDLKSIQNSIISINRPASIVLRSFSAHPSPLPSTLNVHDEDVPWLHENVTRDAVETVLSSRPIGSFLVRRPTSMESSNSFVLSIRVPKYMKRSCVVHYLIDQDELGFRLRGTKKLFPTLNSLIVHHSIVTENLPVVLDLRTSTSLHSMVHEDLSTEMEKSQYAM